MDPLALALNPINPIPHTFDLNPTHHTPNLIHPIPFTYNPFLQPYTPYPLLENRNPEPKNTNLIPEPLNSKPDNVLNP